MTTEETGRANVVLPAIKGRHSVRAFKPDPVPTELLRELMEAAVAAPSWSNTQPWEFAVVAGRAMEELKEAIAKRLASGVAANPDVAFPDFTGARLERRRENGRRLYAELGIGRDDKARQAQYWRSMQTFFGAPAGIIVYLDRELGPYSFLDLGLAIENILLAAGSQGLGSCPVVAVVAFPDVVRRVLDIADAKKMVVGIAIGYADEDSPAARFRSRRDPLDTFVTWRVD